MYKLYNKDYKNRIENFLQRQHFMKLVGISLDRIDEGTTEATLLLKEEHLQQTGLVHGGVITTIADIVAGLAAYTLMPEDCHVVTAELKVSFFSPGKGQSLFAKGWVLKQGYRMNFCEAEVYAIDMGKKKLIAKCTTTMATLFPEDINARLKE